MAGETIDSVFRDFNTQGNPGSGDYKPPKPRIRALLKRMQNASGLAITKNTLAALNGVTPPTENYMGIVLDDPDPSNNGYYSRVSNAWVWERGFRQTFAEFINLGGTANAQTGDLENGVDLSEARIFIVEVETENTGPMTFNGIDVVNAAGNPLSAGEWTSTVLFRLNSDGDYQLLIDAGAAAAAAQSATDAAQDADDAHEDADRAEAARDAALGAVPNVFTNDAASLRQIDTVTTTAAYRRDQGRQFLWDATDLSGTLVIASATTTGVDADTETVTATAHGLLTGMPIVVSAAVDGLSLNTIYYVIRSSADTFQLADSEADAAAGTARDLTGTTNFTVDVLGDPDQIDYVIKTGDALDGSEGAWVGSEDVSPQGSAVGGLSYLRLSSAFKEGSPMLPRYFGVTDGTSDASIAKNTAGLQTALELNYKLELPPDLDTRLGPLTLYDAGCKIIEGKGILRASATGQKLLVTEAGLDGLTMRDVRLRGAATPGQTEGSSLNGLLDLVEALNAHIENVEGAYSLYTAINFLGGSGHKIIGGDYSLNVVPMQMAGTKRTEVRGITVIDSILTYETFKTGPQCRTADGHAYGVCEDIWFMDNYVAGLGNAQAFLAHAGKRIRWAGNTAVGCAAGIAAGANDITDDMDDSWIVNNYVDCDVPTLSASQIAAAYGIRVNGHPDNRAEGAYLSGNTVRRANLQDMDLSLGGYYFQFTNQVTSVGDKAFDCYGNGFLDVSHNTDLLIRDPMVKRITGNSSGRGYGVRFMAATAFDDPQSVNTRVEGGTIEDVATAFRNESANADGTIYIDPNITLLDVTVPMSGLNAGYGPNVKLVSSGTNVDLSNCDTIVFTAGSAHTIATVTNAVIGKTYTFIFTNSNTTVATSGTIYTEGGTDIVGANRKTVAFIAMSQTAIQQASPTVTGS